MPSFHRPPCVPPLRQPRPKRPQYLAAALGLAAAMGTAWAQTPPDAGRLLEETRPPARPALPPATAPRVIEAPVRPTIALPEGVTVTASAFRISGATSYPVEMLAELVKPWVGRKLDITGLNEAAGALTRHYQAQGHLLTYAYIPAQRVADGVIELAVLEGKLEAVQIVTAQDVRLRDEVVQAHTDRLSEQRPVLQADVERQMLLLNDIPGVTARAAFTPGGSTGGADIVVSVAEDEPMDLRLELNNHGSRSTGEVRAGIGLQLRDLFGWGDSTQARAQVSAKGGLVSGSLATQLPVGGDGFRIGASLSRLTYQLAGSFSGLKASGNANTFGVDASYPFVRSADTNLSVKLGLESKRLRDDLGVASTNPKTNRTADLTVSFDHRDGWGGVSAGNMVASMGSLRLLNSENRSADALGLVTARPYRKFGTQLVRQQSLGGAYSLYLRAAAQATGGNLDSSEKFGLSGPGAVRAYAPGEASVDQGGLVTAEVRYAHEYLGGSFVWGLFHDRAEGRVNRRPIGTGPGNDAKLAGTGLSVQWSGGDLGLSASLAWRGSRVPTAEGGDAKPRVYLQVVLTP